ncbi:NAD-dependent dehydratase [Mucilaginibacter corticis]|uniref:NAD-dependent dehydratase n=1 Tax=Mucilaginibacter corticis TaxID=2597670 RepID=A0A556MM66_9SPHI|nr:NAD(P)H-binding protein [Mucilaginibacter corticis]TSJ41021.1 NAD-dependent dehydratase [Mucilaginibacter corticis]
MKIVLTGSMGHISKPLAVQLLAGGHEVTVISSKAERKKEIEALGAKALIGQMEDAEFIAGAFVGAEVVYCMEIIGRHLMTGDDFTLEVMVDKVKKIVTNYKNAIEKNGIKKVIHLSSIGAHTNEGVGLLAFHFEAEKILGSLPPDVSVKFMRPVGFYYNLLDNAPMIKQLSKGFVGAFMALSNYGLGGLLSGKRGVIVSNYGGKVMNLLVSPLDIATVIAEEMELPFSGRPIRYICSEELTCDEVAAKIGKAIGKPYLKWGTISDKMLKDTLVKYKLNPSIALGIVDMGASGRRGELYTDYYAHRPKLAPTKLESYLPEFVKAYEAAPDQND